MGRLDVAMLGPLVVTCDGAPIELGAAKRRAVFAMLALTPRMPVSVSQLVDGVWGEQPPRTVKSSIQVYVAQLRKLFDAAGCESSITRRAGGYVLEIDSEQVDTARFERLVGEGREAMKRGKQAVAVHSFKEASALLRGEVLHDFEGCPFHQSEGRRLDALRVQLASDRFDCLLALGQGGELVADLETLVAHYPYEEKFRAQLMHALYRAGRQVDAMRAFEQARLTLAETGIEPGSTLRAMEQAVLRQDSSLDSRNSPFTPTAPPVPLTSLIGREEDVAKVVALVREDSDRLITLTGPGGVGKTRLGIGVATRIIEEGWSPVAYAALSDVMDPAVVSLSVNAAFGVPDSWKERPVGDIARLLGGSPLLVVIDGAEHLVGIVRDVVRELLEQGPRLRVLLTSRVPLGLPGERQVIVQPLASRLAGDDPSRDPKEAPAVALFIDRCERAGETVEFEAEEIEAIIGICDRVDGLPLGIELAAARSGTLGVRGLLDRLGARLDLVATPGRPGDDRHGSLRRVIEWSHGLLDSQSQRLLARVSVFAGGFTLAHVEEMWADEDPGQLLGSFEELRRNSLLTRVPGATPRRFRLLDTVAEFAREKLVVSGEVVDAHERLIRWIRTRVAATGGRIGAGAVQFESLEPEVDNARAAVAWVLDHGSPDEAAEFCTSLYVWWSGCARGVEMGRWLTRVDCATIQSVALRALALTYLGRIEGRLDHIGLSDVLLRRALDDWRAIGDSYGVAHALTSIVENAVHRGDFTAARPLVEEAMSIARESADWELRCRALHAACWLAGCTGDLEEARKVGHVLVAESAAAGLYEFQAKTLADLSWVERLSGDPQAAYGLGIGALDAATRSGSGGALVSAWTEIELALVVLSRDVEAVRAAVGALTCQSGDDLSPSSIVRVAAPLALIAQRQGWVGVESVATELMEASLLCLPDLYVWPADVSLVGRLVEDVRSRLPDRPASTEVDLLRLARQVGSVLAAEIVAIDTGMDV